MWRSVGDWFWQMDSRAIEVALEVQRFLRAHFGPKRAWCNRLMLPSYVFCLFWLTDAHWWEYLLWISLGLFGFVIMLLIAGLISVLIGLIFLSQLGAKALEFTMALICWNLIAEGLILLILVRLTSGGWRITTLFYLYQLVVLVYGLFVFRGGNQPPRRRKKTPATLSISLLERLTQIVPHGA